MKKKVADRAVPSLTEPNDTPPEKVSAGVVHITALKNSPTWAASAEVQSATAAWSTENDNLAASSTIIAELESKLATARTNQLAVLRR